MSVIIGQFLFIIIAIIINFNITLQTARQIQINTKYELIKTMRSSNTGD